jgi:hypothetical protein
LDIGRPSLILQFAFPLAANIFPVIPTLVVLTPCLLLHLLLLVTRVAIVIASLTDTLSSPLLLDLSLLNRRLVLYLATLLLLPDLLLLTLLGLTLGLNLTFLLLLDLASLLLLPDLLLLTLLGLTLGLYLTLLLLLNLASLLLLPDLLLC